MEAVVEWLCGVQEAAEPPGKPESGQVAVHLGMLFVNNVKLCNLRKDLAGPPERGDQGEVLLRLVGGRWGSLSFKSKSEADKMERTCQALWSRAVRGDGRGLAPALSRLLEATAASGAAGAGAAAPRERSRSPAVRRRRLLRRLSSVEVEGMWRLQHAQDLEVERGDIERRQREAIAEERMRRRGMARGEFLESLRKEAELQRKIQAAEQEEREERQRFEALKAEEERLFLTLQEAEPQAPGDGSADAPAADAAPAPDSEATQPGCPHAPLPEPPAPPPAGDGGAERCVICHDAQRCVVFLPCKHLVCCAGCDHASRRLAQCPMCRAQVVWRFKVFV